MAAMSRVLLPHPDSRAPGVSAIRVEASRPTPNGLVLHYRLEGDLDGLRIPAPAAAERTDGLWRATCFEAFVRIPGAEPYVEFNLAPSTQWSAYRFDRYRQGMAPADLPAPRLATTSQGDGFALSAELDLAALPDLRPEAPWRLALSAVIEDAAGGISYWALAHPAGKPDFHHGDGFALVLAPPISPSPRI